MIKKLISTQGSSCRLFIRIGVYLTKVLIQNSRIFQAKNIIEIIKCSVIKRKVDISELEELEIIINMKTDICKADSIITENSRINLDLTERDEYLTLVFANLKNYSHLFVSDTNKLNMVFYSAFRNCFPDDFEWIYKAILTHEKLE
ncbi:MAG: hypothetical protein MHPSP_000283, partial [Paramarteilia canceri]